ncbi:transposase [Pseudomonas chlororaphis]|uniref:transposase n=1 Tax=Pseudomonas chlororaphis TaxID=587753 RepID=UPI000F587D0D
MLDINIGGVMKKYTEQAKLLVVEDYCSGSAGHREVAHRHGVNASSLRKWIAAYQALGAAGLKSKRKKNYSPEFKLNVLQRMREEELSYRQVAALFDIRKSDIIGEWEVCVRPTPLPDPDAKGDGVHLI